MREQPGGDWAGELEKRLKEVPLFGLEERCQISTPTWRLLRGWSQAVHSGAWWEDER